MHVARVNVRMNKFLHRRLEGIIMAPNEVISSSMASLLTESTTMGGSDVVLYWNAVALDANRESHTDPNGEQKGPTLSARALAIVHLAIHDAFFGITGTQSPYMPLPTFPGGDKGNNTIAAVSAAACTALSALYPSRRSRFEAALAGADIPVGDAAESGAFGRAVALAMVEKLAVKATDPGAGERGYEASIGRGRHRQDPDNPGQGFYGPFYGTTVAPVAVTKIHELKPPPALDSPEYKAALAQVRRKGGASALNSTTRKPEETAIGLYWAYDGANMIGTPPRLYNQIIRRIAQKECNKPEDNARLFALVNVAMADAGTFAWREKFRHDLWRPVLGVREHDPSTGPVADPRNTLDEEADPFWLPLGAPRTNELNAKSVTPNFPAYPSGHATFGAAAFQIVRRFYGSKYNLFSEDDIKKGAQNPDAIAFDFVSDELNGISFDGAGTIRTRHERHFKSLWHAIFENGLSRVYLGVHWIFDAFDAGDVQDPGKKDGEKEFKNSDEIEYEEQIGGVKLGLDIANDIFNSGLSASGLTAEDLSSNCNMTAKVVSELNMGQVRYNRP
jgi:hypothetical protein